MIRLKFAALIALVSSTLHGYEMPVHARITQEAFLRSDLTVNAPELFFRLGFDRLEANHPFLFCNDSVPSFGDGYLDANGRWLIPNNLPPNDDNVIRRCTLDYERRLMSPEYSGRPRISNPNAPAQPGPTPQLRLEAWLMRGAIREDDIEQKYFNSADRPDADPWGDQTRVFNHFYNPVKNERGTPAFGIESLRWALGEVNPFSTIAQTADLNRDNHFSYADARRAYFFALTYKQAGLQSLLVIRQGSDVRMNLWATTLKSLGHVVHLLQDQASPQHARSEPHNHTCTGLGSLANQDPATRTYENFINYRLTTEFNTQVIVGNEYVATNDCEEKFWLGEFGKESANRTDATEAWFRPYPKPKFSIPRKFFTTRGVSDPTNPAALPLAMLNQRAGLGDYSNRGFYTQDNQNGDLASPPPPDSPEFVVGTTETLLVPGLGKVKVQGLFWPVPDPVTPGFADQGLVNGRAPIASQTQWCSLVQPVVCVDGSVLSLRNYNQMADMLLPRAIGYSAGLIDYFFRGKLEIEPIQQRFFGVVDLGQPHTVNADGYPIITATNKILGFEKIRLKVRNLTDPIIESGTNANVPQVVGVGRLVAIARYHRNPCYKPDLSGERRVAYAPAPAFGVVTEPVCPMGLRTDFQEISVSAELPISAEADLPGGRGGTAPASLEKIFDFSADPIPVNATDLFIQVVYRGQLGEETDGIAVGNFDVQEPTFYAGWNNTDYYFNESLTQWLAPTATYPARVINGIRVCAGFPSKWVYFYNALNPQPGLGFPLGAASPGVVRLAFVFAKPATITQRYAVRSSPFVAVPPTLPERSGFTRGQERQASREIFSVASPLPAPSYCQLTPPIVGTTFWCFDPIRNRRGQNFGDVAQPLHYSSGTLLTEFPDVDAAPAQQILPGLIVRTGGENKFDESVLADCPAPAFSPEQRRFIELREEAWSLGIDPDAVGKQP